MSVSVSTSLNVLWMLWMLVILLVFLWVGRMGVDGGRVDVIAWEVNRCGWDGSIEERVVVKILVL